MTPQHLLKNAAGEIKKIGIITLPSFYADFDEGLTRSSVDVERILNRLVEEKMDGLIFDLRNNGGGSLEEVRRMTGFFVGAAPVVQVKNTLGQVQVKDSDDAKPLYTGPMVVMTDKSSASASEILAGAIQDNDRGWIAGRRSFGKGLVQEQSPLPGGAMIRLTIARYYTPTGRCIQKSYKNGKQKYFEELHNRIVHGEMEKIDSIHFCDTLRFVTPKGRVVYGGGGIMPDNFIPADTMGITDYYIKMHEKGILSKFAFSYTDVKRNTLSHFRSIQQMTQWLEKEKVTEKLIQFAEIEGLRRDAKDLTQSYNLLKSEVEATIVRNYFNDSGYYQVINLTDKTLKEALKIAVPKK